MPNNDKAQILFWSSFKIGAGVTLIASGIYALVTTFKKPRKIQVT